MEKFKCKGCGLPLGPVDGIVVQGNIYAVTSVSGNLGGLIGMNNESAVGHLRAETPLKDVEKEAFCFKCFLKAVLF